MFNSLFLDLGTTPLSSKIKEQDAIFLIGSCFSEHFAKILYNYHFSIFHNPFGNLFNPKSIEYSIISSLKNNTILKEDLICVDEVWYHFNYHSKVSDVNKEKLLQTIISEQQKTNHFLKNTSWVFITYGTAWFYELKQNKKLVGNCHKLPASLFDKKLLSIKNIIDSFSNIYDNIKQANQDVKFLLTISPVRHSKDGLVENNQSKAQLITAVHECVNLYNDVFYFPAYEYMIDVLRDYRFYEQDKVHPNHIAIEFIWKRFEDFAFSENTKVYIQEMKEIYLATQHKPFHLTSQSYQKFKQQMFEKCFLLEKKYPHINLTQAKNLFK